ncbi:MAG TPA: hypothetical protein VFZ14_07645 [Burkholderiales bacterium]|nr:hypothetical protein [Burkholderiales bacterium]
MKTILLALLWAAGWMAWSTGHAQNWVAFTPPERDFRALFPELPSQSTAPDGSTVFAAAVSRNEFDVRYAVYRLPSGARLVGDPRSDLQQRLQARARDEERGVRYVQDDGAEPGWERYVFRQGKVVSVHRLVGRVGRYYELEVSLPRGSPELAVRTARDFFNSFQATGIALPSIATITQQLDTWCKDRKDAFSQAFCRYSVCLQPGYEKYPHCAALSGLRNLF